MIRAGTLAALLALACVLPQRAAAQATCTAQPTTCSPATLQLSITIGRAIRLTVSPTTTSLSIPTIADFNAGKTQTYTTGPTVTVQSNSPWSLSMNAAQGTWSATSTQTEPARLDKPASDLQWSTTSGSGYVDMTTSTVTLMSGNATTSRSTSVFYLTKYNWTLDTPGNYSLPIVFTLTAP